MVRYRKGSKIYDFRGTSIRNKQGEIVTPSIFGHGKNQIQVTALGRAKTKIRLTDLSSGEKHEISREDYENFKEELKSGYFKSKESFFKATYWKTHEGMEAQSALAEQNFETMMNSRYSEDPQFADKKPYIMELFRALSYKEKTDFFEEEEKLIRDLWQYNYALSLEDYPELANMTELEYLTKQLEKYFEHNPKALNRIYNRSILESLGYDMQQMIRNG